MVWPSYSTEVVMVPQVYIPKEHGRARVKFDFRPDARTLLRSAARGPEWHKARGFWSVPRSRGLDVARLMAREYGSCEVITWSRLSETELCDTRCMTASGPECVCACGGKNHGSDGLWSGDWQQVGETRLVMTSEDWQLNSRVLTIGDEVWA